MRLEQARLHGYASYADFALSDTMAQSQAAVTTLLERVWAAGEGARRGGARRRLSALALGRGESATIEPWDWRFYAEKVRQARFDIDEAQIKPYFPLERMVEAAFDCAPAPVRARLRGAPGDPRLSPGRPRLRGARRGRRRDRRLPARQLRPAEQAQRRVDERVPKPVAQRRRGRGARPSDHRQQQQFRQGGQRLADPAELRRCAHALPRVRPRPARPALERHLRAPVGHQRAARLRRAAVADLRALARPARGAEAARAPPRERRSRSPMR